MSEFVRIELVPLGTRFEAKRGAALSSILASHGVEFPCGGVGLCGGCRVRVVEGVLDPSPDDVLLLTADELADGWRLACRARIESPLKLEVGQWTTPVLSDSASIQGTARDGLGIAIDLGTTTIVAQIIDFATGRLLGVRSALNPQAAHGADVMSRVRFALSSPSQTPLVRQCIAGMVAELAAGREQEVTQVVIVGNTVMHHLFCGLDVEPLSRVPFASSTSGEQEFSPQQLGWPLPCSCRIRFLRCLGGFVGSDILAGIIAVGMAKSERPIALIDLGTNGEIAVGNCHRILCASTAAGPAFEAGAIKMGTRAAEGAISRVVAQGGKLHCSLIGEAPPRGLCGSGLVDAIAAGLETGAILPNGRFADGIRQLSLAGTVALYQSDVRELQLAKAAIAAGLRILVTKWGVCLDDLEAVHLAGAFGNYVRVESTERIGLLEMSSKRVVASGNTALRGAKMLLASKADSALNAIEHVSLGADPDFQDTFLDCLQFPEPD